MTVEWPGQPSRSRSWFRVAKTPKLQVLHISLALIVVGCGASPSAQDYSVEELVGRLGELGFCPEFGVWEAENNPYFSEVQVGECVNEDVPGGLSANTYPTSDQRVLWLIGALAQGCRSAFPNVADSMDDSFVYVFGDRWDVSPGYTLDDSEVDLVDEVMQQIATETGGMVNMVSCQDLFERLEASFKVWDGAEDAEKAEIGRAALGEPGSDPSLLEKTSG